MLLFTCALHAEARPIIDRFKLKKVAAPFEFFKNDDIALVVSGIGKENMMMATTFLATLHKNSDLIINLGIAGAKNLNIGTLALINKIIDKETQREFYPDILVINHFLETQITTLNNPCKDSTQIETELVDMESSAFFVASSKFFSPHQIVVLKIVSDNLDIDFIKKEFVSSLVANHFNEIVEFLEKARELYKKEELKIDAQRLESPILSFTQRHQLKERLIYEALCKK